VRIAVVQHVVRPAPAQDLEALVAATIRAAAGGASWVVLPMVPALDEGPLHEELWCRLESDAPGVGVLVASADGDASVGEGDETAPGLTVTLAGDDCYSPASLAAAHAHGPGVLVLAPGTESELQAEATLELALALSTSVASVVIVVETDGAEPGEPGHGGSAIIHLGEVLAEALPGDEILYADVEAPVGPPEAPGPLPEIPPLLAQRVAAHQGRKLEVDYPADLG
jgi:predicted amidohydrolase